MLKKLCSILIACALVSVVTMRPALAKSDNDKQSRAAEKVKVGILKLGTGTEARVEVKLRDGTKLKGYISETNEDSFVVVDAKTGASIPVAYPQVKQVKGNNLSNGAKLAIAVGIIVAIVLGVVLTRGK